jgi:hypothetical protein
MSGGSYEYLYSKDVEEIMTEWDARENLERMVNRLAGLGYASDAAQESMKVLLDIRAFEVRMAVMLMRLSPVWKAVEWWDSNDWGEDSVKNTLAKYRGEQDAP